MATKSQAMPEEVKCACAECGDQSVDSLQSRLMHRYQQLCIRRDGWRNIFWLLSKYLLMRPAWFGDVSVPYRTPRVSVRDVHDDTAVDAARTCATALGGALWPNTAESFELVPHIPPSMAIDADFVLQSEEVKSYFEQITKIVRRTIDSPESGFQMAWGEHLDDQVVYGTSGIFTEEIEEDDENPVRFRSASIETCVIDEGKEMLIDTIYFENVWTARQVVDRYGIDAVSERTCQLYESGKFDDWIKVIQAVEPRVDLEVGCDRKEKKNKPFASIHFEWNTRHILKNDGVDERCTFVARFRKRPNEIYGRSLGMDALPTVKELNVLRKGYTKALDKNLDPPLGIYHDQVGGGGQVDISAGSKVPLYDTGAIPQGRKPIEKLYDVPEPQTAVTRLEQLVALISMKFLIDRLLDFNNKTRMTAKESEARMDFRNQALGNIFSRQIIEVLNPMIKWVVNVLWKRKMLGLHPVNDAALIQEMKLKNLSPLVIPPAVVALMVKGKLPFSVRFISPAARAMQADSLLGIEKLTNLIMTYMNAGVHDVIDNVDTDEVIREYQRLCGAPLHVINGKDKVKKNRQQRLAQQAQQLKLQQAEQQATIADKGAKAAKNYAQAGLPNMAAQQQGGQPSAA